MPYPGEFQPSMHPDGGTRWSLRWGLKSPRVGVYECGFCHATFPSLEEFDAHAACPAAS